MRQFFSTRCCLCDISFSVYWFRKHILIASLALWVMLFFKKCIAWIFQISVRATGINFHFHYFLCIIDTWGCICWVNMTCTCTVEWLYQAIDLSCLIRIIALLWEIKSHYFNALVICLRHSHVSQTGLELILLTKVAMNFWSLCFHFLGTMFMGGPVPCFICGMLRMEGRASSSMQLNSSITVLPSQTS